MNFKLVAVVVHLGSTTQSAEMFIPAKYSSLDTILDYLILNGKSYRDIKTK
jgi:hypothetical protein